MALNGSVFILSTLLNMLLINCVPQNDLAKFYGDWMKNS